MLPPMPSTHCNEHGLTRRGLAAAIAAGEVVQVGKGFVVGADRLTPAETPESHAIRVAAALDRMKGLAAGSHGSAALLHMLSRLGRPTSQGRLTRGGGRHRRPDRGARRPLAGPPPQHLTTAPGVVSQTP